MNEMIKPQTIFGFLVVSTLFGIVGGYVTADLIAASGGYYWNSGRFTDLMVICLAAGIALGIVVGCVLDATIRNSNTRRGIVGMLWILLAGSMLMYMLLSPAIDVFRV
jgi:hypothetical protein